MTRAASPVGAHTFIWSPRWDHAGARRAATAAAEIGYDFVEIPLLDPAIIDVEDTRVLLDDLGLGCCCSLGLPAGAHLPDRPEVAKAFLLNAVDVAAALGASVVTGALYGHLGTLTGTTATERELIVIADVLRDVATHADRVDIRLGLEVINRYETYILNTVDQALSLVERIDAPNVRVHIDTFHIDIEEPSIAGAIHRLGGHLGYVHLADSHRGALGSGHIHFASVFDALAAIEFDGPIVVEAFVNADPEILRATASWRDHGLDPDEFASSSLATIRALQASTRF